MNASIDRRSPIPRGACVDTGVWVVTAVVLLLHLVVAGRYDFFRNELYFIICGRHPAFGYVDQPPLIPLIAAATQLFGENLFLLRLPAALASAALVPVTAAIAALLGGRARARLFAALAAGTAPGFLAITSTLGTASLEPLCFALCSYFVLRAVMRNHPTDFVWAGLVAGISLEAKYGIIVWLGALALGLAASEYRRLILSRWFFLGAGLALALVLPNFTWQAVHDWPFLQIAAHHSSEGRAFSGSAIRFFFGQAGAMNIVLAPLWIAGIFAPFFLEAAKPARMLAVAFAIAALTMFGVHGKDYYLFPAFPAMFAVGAVAVERLNKWVVGAWAALALSNAAFLLPIVLPVLSPEGLFHYITRHRLAPPPTEAAAIGASITQVFSDEFPWRAMENSVASVYRKFSPAERQQVGIFASNYGEAAALDFYGQKDALPPATSGQNQYFLWGPGDVGQRTLLLVNTSRERWAPFCRQLTMAAQFGAKFAMPYENNRPIMICRGLALPLRSIWPRLGWFR